MFEKWGLGKTFLEVGKKKIIHVQLVDKIARCMLTLMRCRYPEQQQQPCMEWRAGQARNMARASSKAPMDLLQRQLAEILF